jgi:hypothetical protein
MEVRNVSGPPGARLSSAYEAAEEKNKTTIICSVRRTM